jgi:hypothetical protein
MQKFNNCGTIKKMFYHFNPNKKKSTFYLFSLNTYFRFRFVQFFFSDSENIGRPCCLHWVEYSIIDQHVHEYGYFFFSERFGLMREFEKCQAV